MKSEAQSEIDNFDEDMKAIQESIANVINSSQTFTFLREEPFWGVIRKYLRGLAR